ncbi:hypothetical protein AEYBE204_09600 [Asticcacaulis sp. YBE204]|nr:hypothetical protein AEYBE204_09600 [Asticcacaulis sp. YBE204]
MRDLVCEHLSDKAVKRPLRNAAVQVHSPERASERREIAMTPSELARVMSIAEADGFSVSKWLAAVVRSRLTGTPQFGAAELQALTESNRQLALIGRQLHHLNRVLNGHSSEIPEVSSIDTIRQQISVHTAHVSRLVASNLERWSVK